MEKGELGVAATGEVLRFCSDRFRCEGAHHLPPDRESYRTRAPVNGVPWIGRGRKGAQTRRSLEGGFSYHCGCHRRRKSDTKREDNGTR